MDSNYSHCNICNRDDIPTDNLELHKLRCKKIEKESNLITPSQNNSSSSIAAPVVQPLSTSSSSLATSTAVTQPPPSAANPSIHSRSEEKKEDKTKRNELNVEETNIKQGEGEVEEAIRAPIQPVVERLIPPEPSASSTHPIPMRDLFHAHNLLRPSYANTNTSISSAASPSYQEQSSLVSSSPYRTQTSTAQFGAQVIGGEGRTITTSRTVTLDTGVLLGGATGMLLGAAVGAFFGALSGGKLFLFQSSHFILLLF